MSLQKIRLCCLVEESTLRRQQLQCTLCGPKMNNQDSSTQPALLPYAKSSYRNHKIILIGLS